MQNLVHSCPNCGDESSLARKNGILVCLYEDCDPNKDLEKAYLESLLPYCNTPEICFTLRDIANKSKTLPLFVTCLMREAAESIELLSNRLIERTESLVNQWKK